MVTEWHAKPEHYAFSHTSGWRGCLEARRDLIARAVDSRKDEGSLFEVANRFDLRHRGIDQRSDYRGTLARLDLLVVSVNLDSHLRT